ncbi:MAG: YebC/PmpR family DNA-binding transcriptional regulator [Coriobacteriia bacterium]|nr:YebC/PmpR family DNA-binding transcriptional regulator [Coriobacteriia bacterium]MCL2870577.1 YebC/PmpR family DNA-binding transcriptional regulator [Coriobacteriia bacterium]
MAGHSKWANTKHRKARQDKKRSALFGKLSRAIFVAAKNGDPSPDNNAALAAAIEKAKSYSLPKDNIETAIAKASGAANDGATWNEIIYEGYGPAGIAVYVECLTDNRNRTAADVRAAFTKIGGNLGTSGSVTFQFQRKGEVIVDLDVTQFSEDDFMLAVAEAGGDDYTIEVEDEISIAVVLTESSGLMAAKKALENMGYAVRGAELTMEPTTPQAVEPREAKQVMRLIDRLEDLDDVQNVYHSMKIDEGQLEDSLED